MSIESVEAMSRVFREQHRQMIDEQKKLLEDYRQYFDGVLRQIEERDRMAALAAAAASKPTEDEEDPVKEIAEIGALLDEAVKVHGRELADIIIQLTERQRKKAEATSIEDTEDK
jgi:acyl-CoA reductase-like NAD-dependent aldehyde dehydrogenase